MEAIAIVGFGCAGFSALRAIRESNCTAPVHIFSDSVEPPANPMLTTYFVSGKIPRQSLFPFGSLQEIAHKYNAQIHSRTPITHLDVSERSLTWKGGSGRFSSILLSTGANAIVPPLGAIPGKRILCMRTVSDADHLKAELDRHSVKSILVVGASMVGIKVAELAIQRGLSCTLADTAGTLFPLSAIPSVANEISRRITAQGLSLRLGYGVSNIQEYPDRVDTTFADGSTLSSSLLVLCVGTRPETALARAAGIKINRGIVVDNQMRTSAPGIYAAGDCCEAAELLSHRTQVIGLWSNAGLQGEIAGRCMAGQPAHFWGNISHNITHFMGIDFIGIGDVHAQGQRHTIGTLAGPRYIEAVTATDGTILCINFLNSYLISGVVKNYMLRRLSGDRAPLPPELRGLMAQEQYSDQFIALFERGCIS